MPGTAQGLGVQYVSGEEMVAATADFSFKELGSKQRQNEIILQEEAGFKRRYKGRSVDWSSVSARSPQRESKTEARGKRKKDSATVRSKEIIPPPKFLEASQPAFPNGTLFCRIVFQTSNANNFHAMLPLM